MVSIAASACAPVRAPVAVSSKPQASVRSSFAGQTLKAASVKLSNPRFSFAVRAEAEAAKVKEEPKAWAPPKLNPNTPSPIFGGSTGGLLRKAQVEEFYVITWDAKKEQIFEMPTGGAAIMRKGANLLKLARKEQALALTTQLRSKFKTDAVFYRVFPSGEVQYLHPKDGVYPEKVNAGRVGSNTNMRRIGQNKNPAQIKWTNGMAGFTASGAELK